MSSLRATQMWFAKAVTQRAGPRNAARQVAFGPRLGRLERLGIYRFAYLERLRSVLANDYPAVRHLVGAERFTDLVAAYARAHPSRHPNLNRFGAKFPEFLAARDERAFLVELARLELAIARATEANQAPVLEVASLARLDAEQQRSLRLRLQPSVHLLAGRFATGAWHDAWSAGKPMRTPRRARSWTCVHRVGWRVQVSPLGAAQFAVLRAIAAGATLAAALRHAGPSAPIGRWFTEWASKGLFVDPSDSSSGREEVSTPTRVDP